MPLRVGYIGWRISCYRSRMLSCSSDSLGTSRLELIRRIELEGERLAWVAPAATFRVIWGKVEEETDGGITDDRGVRKNLRVALEEGADPAITWRHQSALTP